MKKENKRRGKELRAHLICSGTELLLGQTVNTNAAYLGRELAALGIDLYTTVTVGDNMERFSQAIIDGSKEADLILISGGLGPTEDDITRDVLARALNIPLVYHEEAAGVVERFFQRRGSEGVPENNSRQTMAPAGAKILDNPYGTAPGIYYEHKNKIYVLLPGPPRELIPMYEQELLPLLGKQAGPMVILSRVLKLAGKGESMVEDEIKDLLSSTNPTIAPTAKRGEVNLRITAKGKGIQAAQAMIEPVEKAIRERLGEYIFGVDEDSLEGTVGQLLLAKNLTISVAESCTGGLLAHRLTNIPGSSGYFQLGTVVYHNRWKEEVNQVPASLLAAHGAVSPQVAQAMAQGIRNLAGTAIGIGITGIAGPGGGTEDKPVGLVYMGMDFQGQVEVWREQLVGSREDIKWRATQWVLMTLFRRLSQMGS